MSDSDDDLILSEHAQRALAQFLAEQELSRTEFEKTIVFIVIFLENSKIFVIFTKSTNKFGEFLNFLGFS